MTTGGAQAEALVDLADTTLWDDEDEVRRAFAVLREQQPVSWQREAASEGVETGPGYWAVVRHGDVQRVSLTPGLFASAPATSLRSLPDTLNERIGSMQHLDDPKHATMRRVVSHAFTPRRVRALQGDIVASARELVAKLRADGGGDLITSLGLLPLNIICDLMGIPDEMRFDVLMEVFILTTSRDASAMQTVADSLHGRALRLAEQRRAHPGTDLVSTLVQASVDGESLTPDEIGSFFILLATAGALSVSQVLITAAVALHEYPDQRAAWAQDPAGLTPTAVDELIRWSTPGRYFRRTATERTMLSGVTIEAGDKVVVWYTSANQDPTVFDLPEHLDLRRNPNPHLAFGAGPHFCLGAQLARVEIAAVMTALLEAGPQYRVTSATRMSSSFAAGYSSVIVEM